MMKKIALGRKYYVRRLLSTVIHEMARVGIVIRITEELSITASLMQDSLVLVLTLTILDDQSTRTKQLIRLPQ
jgi:hypothetical protein